MFMKVFTVAVLVAAIAAQPALAGDASPARFERVDMDGFKSFFLLEYPAGYDEEKTWPLIVALHGMGDSAEDFFLAWDGIPSKRGYFLAVPDGDSSAPCMCGKCSATVKTWSAESLKFVRAVIDESCRRGKVDEGRVYLAGFSAGGHMAFYSGLKNPGLFAAVVPFAGAAMRGFTREDLWLARSLPVICFVGSRDPGRTMVLSSLDGLKKEGFPNVSCKVVEGAGHELPVGEIPGLLDDLDRMAEKRKRAEPALDAAVSKVRASADGWDWKSAVGTLLRVLEPGVHCRASRTALEILWEAESVGRRMVESAIRLRDDGRQEDADLALKSVADEFQGLPCAEKALELLGKK